MLESRTLWVQEHLMRNLFSIVINFTGQFYTFTVDQHKLVEIFFFAYLDSALCKAAYSLLYQASLSNRSNTAPSDIGTYSLMLKF